MQVGAAIIDSFKEHAMVDCGFASISDVRTFALQDQMDSFVLAETFKYVCMCVCMCVNLLIST